MEVTFTPAPYALTIHVGLKVAPTIKKGNLQSDSNSDFECSDSKKFSVIIIYTDTCIG